VDCPLLGVNGAVYEFYADNYAMFPSGPAGRRTFYIYRPLFKSLGVFRYPAAISELTPSCISPKQKYISGGSYVCLLLTLEH
jgi:hypothetical protein